MLELVDFYHVLQVDPEAEPETIRAAYRTLARLNHPDMPGGSHARMVMLNQAWSVLGDERARRVYDRGRLVLTTPPRANATQPAAGRPATGRPAAGRPATPRASATAAPDWSPNHPGAPAGAASGTVLDFGRYAGWSFGQIARHDPDFLEWLVRTPIGRPYRAEIETLLGQRAGAATATATAEPPRRRRFGRR